METITREQQQKQLERLNDSSTDIISRAISGLPVSSQENEFYRVMKIVDDSLSLIAELNSGYHTHQEVRKLFSRLVGKKADDGFELFPPFYTDFGKNIKIGMQVFINQCCTFMDCGGITIGDGAIISAGAVVTKDVSPIQ